MYPPDCTMLLIGESCSNVACTVKPLTSSTWKMITCEIAEPYDVPAVNSVTVNKSCSGVQVRIGVLSGWYMSLNPAQRNESGSVYFATIFGSSGCELSKS